MPFDTEKRQELMGKVKNITTTGLERVKGNPKMAGAVVGGVIAAGLIVNRIFRRKSNGN